MIPPPPSYFAICFSLSLYTFFTILLILIWSFLPPLQFTRLALPSLPFLPAPFSPASLHHLLPPPSSLPLLLTAATLHHSRPFATPTRPAWRHAANTWANSNIYPFCYFWSLQSSQQGGMESIDGRNLILPFPLRVERHSLSFIFGGEGARSFSPHFASLQRSAPARTSRALTHPTRLDEILHRGQPRCLHASARPPTSRIDFPPRGGKFER